MGLAPPDLMPIGRLEQRQIVTVAFRRPRSLLRWTPVRLPLRRRR
jgi:hypothetical protein